MHCWLCFVSGKYWPFGSWNCYFLYFFLESFVTLDVKKTVFGVKLHILISFKNNRLMMLDIQLAEVYL